MSKYDFSSNGRDRAIVHAFRIYLRGEPIYSEVQQLLHDLTAQTYRFPSYLFLSEEDLRTLSMDVIDNHERFFIGATERYFYGNTLCRIPGPRDVIYVSPLQALKKWVVIAGFIDR